MHKVLLFGEDDGHALVLEALTARIARERGMEVQIEVQWAQGGLGAMLRELRRFLRLGPYRVLRQLGQGGMGLVYEAEDQRLKRRVALKVMLPQHAANTKARQRFLREAQAQAAIEHDHIVAIFQADEDDGVPFIAMPLLKGETLSEVLKRDGRVPLADLLRIGRETAEGLSAAHEQGLIHRDIKPSNLWLEARGGRRGVRGENQEARGERREVRGENQTTVAPRPSPLTPRVKILDFGLARAAQVADDAHLTGTGVALGTPAYMAPEQARGEAVDARSDLFSLGCVLYQMGTGALPFQGSSVMAVLNALANGTPTPPRELNPDLPAGLAELIERLLAKNPTARPADAQAVADALAALERTSVAAAPTEMLSAAAATVTPSTGQAGSLPHTVRGASCQLAPPRQGSPKRRRFVLALAFLATIFILAGGIFGIIRIATPEGDYVIDTDDPDFAFSVSKGTVLLEDKKTKRNYNLKVLKQTSGEFELEVTDPDHDLAFNSKTFTIKRGQTVALKAWFERKQATLPAKYTNSLGMEFVLVGKGTAWLGGGGGKLGDKVEIGHDFYLGKYEVTQEEWEKLTGLTPSNFSRAGGGKDAVKDILDPDLKRFPVEQVSWEGAQLFLESLNKWKKEAGWNYRLPKQTEWEYACRGGPLSDKLDSAFDFYFDKPTNLLLPEKANFEHGKGLKRTCKVGSYPPNRLGLYDMHGNVWEWCDDESPPDPNDPKGATQRVLSGGSWRDDAGGCRAAHRLATAPSNRDNNLGLRLARVPVGQGGKKQ
jgi:serine/threonine protein kinase